MPVSLSRFIRARLLMALLLLGLGGLAAAPSAYAIGLPFHDFKWYSKHMYYRLGYGRMLFVGSSGPLVMQNVPPAASLALNNGPVPGTGVTISNYSTILGTLGFILPWGGNHLSLEANVAPPLKFYIYANQKAANQSLAALAFKTCDSSGNCTGIPTGVKPIGRTIGHFRSLPPNFTLVYRPFLHTVIRPYIGAGLIWLFTYDVNVTNRAMNSAPGSDPHLHLSRPIGCVGQAGFDISLPLDFYLTADAKYIGCATVHSKLTGVRVQTNFGSIAGPGGSAAVGPITNTLHYRVLLYSLTIGRSFWG